MKKLISLFLAIVMFVSSAPVVTAIIPKIDIWCNICNVSRVKCIKEKCNLCKGESLSDWGCKIPRDFEEDFIRGQITIVSQDVNRIRIGDAIEIFKYLSGMDSVIKKRDDSFRASLITLESQFAGKPSIDDALEILKYLAGMNSELGLR